MDDTIEKKVFDDRVDVPVDYFYKMSMMDYGNPYMAVIREFFQNSFDAGCKNFTISLDNEKNEISFSDDGCGMNEDIIRNRLLVMGGSYKEDENAVGSFGHAKVLIYFSWNEYEIRTRNLRVTGKANMYSIETLGEDDYVNGTISRIFLSDADFNKIYNEIRSYFNLCNTDVNVTLVNLNNNNIIETEVIYQNLNGKIPIQVDGDFIDVYIGNDLDNNYSFSWLNKQVYVRSRGVYMFCTYTSVLKFPIIVETRLPAREIFTQNRDSFKSEYQKMYNELINRLTNDNVSSVNAAFQNFLSKKESKKNRHGNDKNSERKEVLNIDNFYIWGKTHREAERYFKKTRVKRMSLFLKETIKKYKRLRNPDLNIECGFVFDPSVDGIMLKSDKRYTVFVNPITVEKEVINKRKMSWKLMNIICHELAHIETFVSDGVTYHNEGFVLKLHKIFEIFWDESENYKRFKECWNSFRG